MSKLNTKTVSTSYKIVIFKDQIAMKSSQMQKCTFSQTDWFNSHNENGLVSDNEKKSSEIQVNCINTFATQHESNFFVIGLCHNS